MGQVRAKQGRGGRTLWRILAAVLLALVLLVLAIPEGLRLLVEDQLRRQQIGEASIDDIDLHLLRGQLRIHRFALQRDGQRKAAFNSLLIDWRWRDLWARKLTFNEIVLEGLRLDIVQRADGGWEVVIPLPANSEQAPASPSSAAPPPWWLRELQLRDIELGIHTRELSGKLALASLQVLDLSSDDQRPLQMSLRGRWNDAALALSLQADHLFSQTAVQGHVQLDDYALSELRPWLPAPLADLAGRLSLAQDFVWQRDGELSSRGHLALDEVALRYAQLDIQLQALQWQGSLDPLLLAPSLHYRLGGDLSLAGLAVADRQYQRSLLSLQQLQAGGLSLDERQQLSLAVLDLTALQAIQAEAAGAPQLRLGHLQLKQLSWSTLSESTQRLLAAEQLQVDDLALRAQRNADGSLQAMVLLQQSLDALAAQQPAPAAEAADSTEPPQDAQSTSTESAPMLALDALLLQRASIDWDDRMLASMQPLQLQIARFSLQQLDQRQPQQVSPLALEARLDEFSSLLLGGELQPFLPEPAVQLEGDFKQLSLPMLSPYSEQAIGYQLSAGHYDHQFELHLAQRQFKMENTLWLRQLSVAKAAQGEPLGVPLGMSLDLLRDGDGNIKLKVPVKGSLDDPDIGVGQVVRKALGSALKRGSVGYLKLALQPYGAILMAAELVGDKLSQMSLQPALFSPGSSALDAGQRDYMSKLAALMTEKKSLSLQLCGQSNADDRTALIAARQAPSAPPPSTAEGAQPTLAVPELSAAAQAVVAIDAVALQADLLALAQERATALKRELIAQGSAPEQLFVCKAHYDEKALNGVRLAM